MAGPAGPVRSVTQIGALLLYTAAQGSCLIPVWPSGIWGLRQHTSSYQARAVAQQREQAKLGANTHYRTRIFLLYSVLAAWAQLTKSLLRHTSSYQARAVVQQREQAKSGVNTHYRTRIFLLFSVPAAWAQLFKTFLRVPPRWAPPQHILTYAH